MKLLKLRLLNGYKMLGKDFEINFLTKTRVDKDADNNELIELENNLYYPIETIFIGKNSSGKSTTLEFIQLVYDFFRNGRVFGNFLNGGDEFGFEAIFYNNGLLYKYIGTFKKDAEKDNNYLTIVDESLTKTSMKASYKKDLSNASFFKVDDFKPNNGGDTSDITKMGINLGYNFSVESFSDSTRLFNIFYDFLKEETFYALLHLFDDSVEYIKPYLENGNQINAFEFKRKGTVSRIVDKSYLDRTLSKGTIRGINLYGISILAFQGGGTIIVDEIERSFNRNLIENLLFMFTDKTINRENASIIYSTHYSEILDGSERCDNINILHREGESITLKNMCNDYELRTDMLKSNQFNQNAFDTLINYDRLMDLKDTLRK